MPTLANLMYYFKYVEGNEALFTTYSMVLMIPSIIGAAAFPFVFRWLGNKGRTATISFVLAKQNQWQAVKIAP